jgi:hypothetical protein
MKFSKIEHIAYEMYMVDADTRVDSLSESKFIQSGYHIEYINYLRYIKILKLKEKIISKV